MLVITKMSLYNLAVVQLSVYHALSADGCGNSIYHKDGGSSVKCGTECTGVYGSCTCGENTKSFNHLDNTTLCCNGRECQKNGNDIFCKYGIPLPLTTPCEGECNDHRSYFGGRQYRSCNSKAQCIKIQHFSDGVYHCSDRSDERRRPEDAFTPIEWDKLTSCSYMFGYAGLKCSGQG